MSKTVQKPKPRKELTEKQLFNLCLKIFKSLPLGKVFAIDSFARMQVVAVSRSSLFVYRLEKDGYILRNLRYDYFNRIILEKQDGTSETLWERNLEK